MDRADAEIQALRQEIADLQHFNNTPHLDQLLEQENHTLKKELRSLNLVLEDKSARLASEMNSQINLFENGGREQSKERVSLEQIQFYQKKYDDSYSQMRDLFKLTQRFLLTMKQLQKAVHRREPNVSKEKNEFEETRRDLELRLREIKKEIE